MNGALVACGRPDCDAEVDPTPSPNGKPRLYCGKDCQRKAKRNRWTGRRQRRRRALSREDCPTPNKWVFLSEAEARSHLEKTGNRLYRCPGVAVPHFHTTSQGNTKPVSDWKV